MAPIKRPYDDMIRTISAKYGMDYELIHAVIKAESNYNLTAQSPAGARGLMQLMPGTARGLGVTNRDDAYQNIDGGTRYLRNMIKRFNGDVLLGLAAYNAGPNRQSLREGRVPNIDETQAYVRRIHGYYKAATGGKEPFASALLMKGIPGPRVPRTADQLSPIKYVTPEENIAQNRLTLQQWTKRAGMPREVRETIDRHMIDLNAFIPLRHQLQKMFTKAGVPNHVTIDTILDILRSVSTGTVTVTKSRAADDVPELEILDGE